MGSMTNFRSEDMPGQVAYASDSPKPQKAAAAPATAPEPEPEPEATGSEVPEGTTAEILAWVGDDQERAQAALDAEQASDKPRVGLTGELEKILATEDDEG
jgi:hypothetical protein